MGSVWRENSPPAISTHSKRSTPVGRWKKDLGTGRRGEHTSATLLEYTLVLVNVAVPKMLSPPPPLQHPPTLPNHVPFKNHSLPKLCSAANHFFPHTSLTPTKQHKNPTSNINVESVAIGLQYCLNSIQVATLVPMANRCQRHCPSTELHLSVSK